VADRLRLNVAVVVVATLYSTFAIYASGARGASAARSMALVRDLWLRAPASSLARRRRHRDVASCVTAVQESIAEGKRSSMQLDDHDSRWRDVAMVRPP
jgi:hypothetical protein